MSDSTVELIYRAGPPADYAARLGRGGWLEAWGWTEEEAVRNLAGKVLELDPERIPPGHRDQAAATAWLLAHCPIALLAD